MRRWAKHDQGSRAESLEKEKGKKDDQQKPKPMSTRDKIRLIVPCSLTCPYLTLVPVSL